MHYPVDAARPHRSVVRAGLVQLQVRFIRVRSCSLLYARSTVRHHLSIAAVQIKAKKHVEALSRLDLSLLMCHTFTVLKHVGLVGEYSELGVSMFGETHHLQQDDKNRNFLSMLLTMKRGKPGAYCACITCMLTCFSASSRSISTQEAVPAWQEAMEETVLAGRVVTKEAVSQMWVQLRRDIAADAARAIALVRAFNSHHC